MTLPSLPDKAADNLAATEVRLDLSERELEILKLVATGASNKQIAQQLTISPNTVRVHLRNIFGKINVASRTEAAMLAVRSGLVKVADASSLIALDEPGPETSAEPLPNAEYKPALITPETATPLALVEQPIVVSSNVEGVAPVLEAPFVETDITTPDEPAVTLQAPLTEARLDTPVELSPAPVSAIPQPEPVAASTAIPHPAPTTLTRWSWRRWGGVGLLGVLLLIIFGLLQNRPVVQGPTATLAPTVTPPPRWVAQPAMPGPRSGFGTVVYETQLYVVGGADTTGLLTSTLRYDPATKAWSTLAPLPLAVTDVGAAVVGGKIYVPGGQLSTGAVTSTLQVYDPRTDVWATRTPLPVPMSAYALVAFEGRLLLFGGWNGAAYTNTVWEYQPSTNEWQAKSPMPTARGLMGATLAGGKIYIIGGTAGQQALTAHEIYTPDEDDGGLSPWRVGPPLPMGRVGSGVVSAADLVYVVGGSDGQIPLTTTLEYLPTQALWQVLEPAPEALGAQVGSVVVGADIYVLGGQQPPAVLAQMWIYHAIYTTSFPVVGGE